MIGRQPAASQLSWIARESYPLSIAHVSGENPRSANRVHQREREEGVAVVGALDTPRKRQIRPGADGGVDLIAVEPSTFARRDSGAVAPRRVGVGEPLSLWAVLGEVALTVRIGRKVGRVNLRVNAHLRHNLAERRRDAGEAGVQQRLLFSARNCSG